MNKKNEKLFLTVCLNPTLQKTLLFDEFRENQVNRCAQLFMDASGKGVNVSRILDQLNQKVHHITQLGGKERELFCDLVHKSEIPLSYVESESQVRYCSTLLNRKKGTTTEIIEPTLPVGNGTEEKFINLFRSLLPKAHTLIISGTKAPGFSDDLYPQLVREAKGAELTVILDLKGKDLINSLPLCPDFIKPNLSEFAATFFSQETVWENQTSEEHLKRACRKMEELFSRFNTKSIITRGSEGCLFHDGEKISSVEAEVIEPVNTIGCGDAFTAGFASDWHAKKDIKEAVKTAMKTALLNALTVRPGTLHS
ncbi:MAG: 1-phosphofructokinase family hexose kinase [Chitinispirillaceae bacterium]